MMTMDIMEGDLVDVISLIIESVDQWLEIHQRWLDTVIVIMNLLFMMVIVKLHILYLLP